MKNHCFILVAVLAVAAVAYPAANPLDNHVDKKSNTASFPFTVVANNTRPTVAAITNVHTVMSTPFAPVMFTVTDAEDSSDLLSVSAASSDELLIPNVNLVFGGP